MDTYHKRTGFRIWSGAVLLIILASGCGGDDNDSGEENPATVPTVIGTSPEDGSVAVTLNNKVVATFSETMDAATIDGASFTVTGAGEPALVGVVTVNKAATSASFTPSSHFTVATLYTVTLGHTIKSAAGIPLAGDHVWRFNSGTVTDAVAPVVISTSPADMANDVFLNQSLSANVSEELDPASVTGNTVTLSDGSSLVAGEVSYNNKVVSFNPTASLSADTVYTATLSTAITDQAVPANPLAADVVWSFRTGTAVATGRAAVNLRTAGDFVILSKTGISNVHTSTVRGNIGASPITAAAMDSVFCTEILGTIYGSDAAYTGSGAIPCFAGAATDSTLVANAVLDMETAYADAAGRTTPEFIELHAGDISGQTLVPGLYKWSTGVSIVTDVTLSGGPHDVWIFQIAGDITQSDRSSILLTGGASAKNIFWQVAGDSGVALGTSAHFEGIVLAEKRISVNTGASVNGRLLSQTAVTLAQNTIRQPASITSGIIHITR